MAGAVPDGAPFSQSCRLFPTQSPTASSSRELDARTVEEATRFGSARLRQVRIRKPSGIVALGNSDLIASEANTSI